MLPLLLFTGSNANGQAHRKHLLQIRCKIAGYNSSELLKPNFEDRCVCSPGWNCVGSILGHSLGQQASPPELARALPCRRNNMCKSLLPLLPGAHSFMRLETFLRESLKLPQAKCLAALYHSVREMTTELAAGAVLTVQSPGQTNWHVVQASPSFLLAATAADQCTAERLCRQMELQGSSASQLVAAQLVQRKLLALNITDDGDGLLAVQCCMSRLRGRTAAGLLCDVTAASLAPIAYTHASAAAGSSQT